MTTFQGFRVTFQAMVYDLPLVFTHHQVQGQICAQLNNRNIQEMEKTLKIQITLIQ